MNGMENGGGVTPPEDMMRYDLLVEFALRQVVRMALQRVQRSGLPGEHHFYIAFNTRHPAVHISDRLRQKYPEEMTIVLQHQFWDLKVLQDRFEVGLSFGGIPEKLSIPFEAVKGFYDPHVQFALQFHEMTEEEQAVLEHSTGSDSQQPDTAPAASPAGATTPSTPLELGAILQKPAEADDENAERKVVSLDAFRKKP